MENSKLSDVKGKELVAAGHAFAKAIGMDTPLIEIAKMVSVLATRLDCALVRGDELQKERDTLAAENAALTGFIQKDCCVYRGGIVVNAEAYVPETPATAAYLNSVRADAVEAFAHQQRVIADSTPAAAFQRDRRFAAGLAEDFAAQLRAGEPS